MHRLLDQLSCDATDAGDYEGVANEATRGADCWTEAGQLRVHVFDVPISEQSTEMVGTGAVLLTEDLIEQLGLAGKITADLPAVVGENWIVVAEGPAAATYAHDRLGGSVEPVTTPASYLFPTQMPVDAQRRASDG